MTRACRRERCCRRMERCMAQSPANVGNRVDRLCNASDAPAAPASPRAQPSSTSWPACKSITGRSSPGDGGSKSAACSDCRAAPDPAASSAAAPRSTSASSDATRVRRAAISASVLAARSTRSSECLRASRSTLCRSAWDAAEGPDSRGDAGDPRGGPLNSLIAQPRCDRRLGREQVLQARGANGRWQSRGLRGSKRASLHGGVASQSDRARSMRPVAGAGGDSPQTSRDGATPPAVHPRKQPRVSALQAFVVASSRADATSVEQGRADAATSEDSKAVCLACAIQGAVDGCWWAESHANAGAVIAVGGSGGRAGPGVPVNFCGRGVAHQLPLRALSGDEAWALIGLGRLQLRGGGALAAARAALGQLGAGCSSDHAGVDEAQEQSDCKPRQCVTLLALMPTPWPALASAAALAELLRRGCDARSSVWHNGLAAAGVATTRALGHVWLFKQRPKAVRTSSATGADSESACLADRPSSIIFACEDAGARACMTVASDIAASGVDPSVVVAVFCLGSLALTVVSRI